VSHLEVIVCTELCSLFGQLAGFCVHDDEPPTSIK
jgi:hypothetical protein